MIRTAGALALFAVAGLVGSVIDVHPESTVAYYGMASACDDPAGRFFSVAASREDTTPATYALRAAVVNPAAATAGISSILVTNANMIADPAVAWNLTHDRHLVVFTMPDATTVRRVMGLVLDRA